MFWEDDLLCAFELKSPVKQAEYNAKRTVLEAKKAEREMKKL